jgi:hypothetical protein
MLLNVLERRRHVVTLILRWVVTATPSIDRERVEYCYWSESSSC